MATMSMNKAIHCAVRRDLRRFLGATASFSDGDSARAAALGRAWDNFHEQLTHHHEGEHEIAWPAMLEMGVSQGQLDTFDSEHEAMATSLQAAGAAMGRFRTSASEADAAAANTALTELQQVTETHLANEEAAIESLMLDNADHPVIKEMGKKFGKVPLGQGGTFFVWVQDGAEPEARAAIEAYVPKPVLAIIGGIFGRRYRREVAPVWA